MAIEFRTVLKKLLCSLIVFSVVLGGCQVRKQNEGGLRSVGLTNEAETTGQQAGLLFKTVDSFQSLRVNAQKDSQACPANRDNKEELIERINKAVKRNLTRLFLAGCLVAPVAAWNLIGEAHRSSVAQSIGEPAPALLREKMNKLQSQKLEAAGDEKKTRALDDQLHELQKSKQRVNEWLDIRDGGILQAIGTGLVLFAFWGGGGAYGVTKLQAEYRKEGDSTLGVITEASKLVYGGLKKLKNSGQGATQQQAQVILDQLSVLFSLMDPAAVTVVPKAPVSRDQNTGMVEQAFVVVPDYLHQLGGAMDVSALLDQWPKEIPRVEFVFRYAPNIDELLGEMILVRPTSNPGPNEVLFRNMVTGGDGKIGSKNLGSVAYNTAQFALGGRAGSDVYNVVQAQLPRTVSYFANALVGFREMNRAGSQLPAQVAALPAGQVLPVEFSEGRVIAREPVVVPSPENKQR